MSEETLTPRCWLHARYIIGMLLMLLVYMGGALLDLWKIRPHAIDFAATLSAILLAVISMVYAFFSTDTLSKDLSSIRISADRVGAAASDLKDTSNQIVNQISEALQRTAGDVKNTVSTAMAGLNIGSTTPQQEARKVPTEEEVNHFYSRTSFYAVCALYVLSEAAKRKLTVDPGKFAAVYRGAPQDGLYELGLIVACNNLEFIEVRMKQGAGLKPTRVPWPKDKTLRELLEKKKAMWVGVSAQEKEKKIAKIVEDIETYIVSLEEPADD